MEHRNEQEVIEEVTRRAAIDVEFRQKLLADARGTISGVIGQSVPETVNIKFVEKDPGLDALIVLPDYIPAAAELSAEQLEAVAGGQAEEAASGCWVYSCTWTCVWSNNAFEDAASE